MYALPPQSFVFISKRKLMEFAFEFEVSFISGFGQKSMSNLSIMSRKVCVQEKMRDLVYINSAPHLVKTWPS